MNKLKIKFRHWRDCSSLLSKRQKHPFLSGLLQTLGILCIFYLVTLWQQSHMLETTESIDVPGFSLPTNDGETLTLSSFRQQQPVLIYFFAPWCKVCHFSIDTIESIRQDPDYQYLKIVAVALDWKNKQAVDAFVARHQLTFPVVYGTSRERKQWKVHGYPSYYLINQKGQIVSRDTGLTTKAGLLWRLKMAL